MRAFNEQWTADVVGKLHYLNVTQTAVKMARLEKRITLIEKIAREVFSTDLLLFDAVIHGYKVDDDRYRGFFWRLDQARD